MKFVSIVGARPQFVKLAAVSRALRERHEEVIVHTGQHYDDSLSGSFFRDLAIPAPDHDLGIGSGAHGAQTGRMLEAVEAVLVSIRPDGVIVYGDTNSTLAGALAAAKLHVPVAHVEAGLRSYDRRMPEEVNRVLTDHLSTRLFCPTETARQQLRREGLEEGVEVVGDVMCDALRYVRPRLDERAAELLPALGLRPGDYVLLTIHRAANTDDPGRLSQLVAALDVLDVPVIFPVHPRTRAAMERHGIAPSRLRLVEPVGYLDMLALERCAHRVVTDSGGVQKEAFLLGVPCVTLRDETEWPETVEAGWNTLVGADGARIAAALALPMPPPARTHPYGHGDAAVRIAASLDSWPAPGGGFR